jgi:hypothetical protein
MDEKAKTELVLVIQQNSITDIITFLKTLESDVRTFRELKSWPIIESKLLTVLNIRKVLRHYPVDNISLSVSAHSRLRSISDQDTTLTILKRKVTVIVLECMHKLHLLGRFLTSTHDLDVISMASVELRRVKDELVLVGQTQEDTMEDIRPEDDIKKSIGEFLHKIDESDRDTPELGTLVKNTAESKEDKEQAQRSRRLSKEEGDIPSPNFLKGARQLREGPRDDSNRLSCHRLVGSWSPSRPTKPAEDRPNISIQISQRHFQTSNDTQENVTQEASSNDTRQSADESGDDLVGEHPQKRNMRNRTKALFKRIVTHFATIRTNSTEKSNVDHDKIKRVLQYKERNDEKKVAKVRDGLGRGHKSEPSRTKHDRPGVPSNRSRSDLTKNDNVVNNTNVPKLAQSSSSSPLVSPSRSPSRSPTSSPLSSPISSPRELSDDESYNEVDRSYRQSRRKAALYKLNINPNSAQALERLGSISISPDSPTSSATWPSEEDGQSNIREVFTEKGAKVIHCATLHKLIERLTSPISFEHKLLTIVMLTYRSFTTPQELFTVLKQRFFYAQKQELIQSPRNIRGSWRKSPKRKSAEANPPLINSQQEGVNNRGSLGLHRNAEGNLELETNLTQQSGEKTPPVNVLTQSAPLSSLESHNDVNSGPNSPNSSGDHHKQLTSSISMSDLQPKSEWNSIQLRVINVLKRWIEGNFADFDEGLITELFLFLEHLRKDTTYHLADKLEHALMNKIVGVTKDQAKMFKHPPPLPIVPKNTENITFEDVDTLELARQISLRDFRSFSAIQPSELLDGAWSKPKLQFRSPRVLEMIHDSNDMSTWVMSVIIKTVSLKKRVKIYTKFVSLASKLLKLNNFHSTMSIYSGLCHYAVHRLKLTREELPAKTKQKLLHFEQVFSNDFSNREYRAALKSVNPPAVPHLAIHLRDLIHIEEGNPDTIDGLINVRKRGFVAQQIEDLAVFQKPPYNFTPVECIQEFLENLPQDDPEELYQISLTIEPRESANNTNNNTNTNATNASSPL